jgi:hypothetical protein
MVSGALQPLVNSTQQGSRERRSMLNGRITMLMLGAVVLGAAGIAQALDCEGRLVSIGDSPLAVLSICGEPAQVGDSVEVILKPVYHPNGSCRGALASGGA